MNSNCPLCQNSENNARKNTNNEYYSCKNCKGIFKSKQNLLTPEQEKQRYQQHNNDVNDPNYQNFVNPIVSKITHNYTPDNEGLDFGCGPGPVISKLLKDQNYNIQEYDPYFANHQNLLQKNYDYIACCEVAEHFNNPKKEFQLLKSLLKPKGKLFIMNLIYDETIDFNQWYYKNDPTHVFFYQKETFKYIQKQFNFSYLTIENRLITLSN